MVIFAFWIAAMILTLLALGLLLPPLLRTHGAGGHRRAIERELATLKRRLEAGQIDEATYGAERERLSTALLAAVETRASAPARSLAVVLALALPVSALALYFALGTPEALDPSRVQAAAPGATAQDMETALATLESRLREQPDDVEGWLLLARSYRAMARFNDMRRATSSAFALAPDSPDVMVEHAEAITLNAPTRRFEGEALQLLQAALATDADHHKALWLLGVAELQSGRPAQAAAHWERLRGLLPPGDPVAARIDEQIAAARAQATNGPVTPGSMPPGGTGSATEGSAAAPPQSGAAGTIADGASAAGNGEGADAGDGPRVLVTVTLSDALRDRLSAGDTLFVFARNPAGGPPLAIRRIDSPAFPATVTLSTADRMIEGMQLSEGAEVSIGARISKSGQATPQPGDLEAAPATLTLNATHTLALDIDRLVE
jgi:cytochrome c-type biogenesis protein CcmH